MIGQLSLGGEPQIVGDDAAGREAQRLVLKRIVARLTGKVAEAATGLEAKRIEARRATVEISIAMFRDAIAVRLT